MANAWFRFYAEFDSDPKVQMMSEAMQRRLVMLFCRHCDGAVTSRDDELAFHWRVTPQEIAETKALFLDKGFITEDWNLVNWDRRQFVSDSSKTRTKRYRERLQTSQKQVVTVPVTSHVTKCDAPEQNRTEQNRTKSHFVLPDWIDPVLWKSFEEMRQRIRKPMTDDGKRLAIKKLESLRSQGHSPQSVIENSVMNSYQGFFPPSVSGKTEPPKREYIA